MPSQSSQHDAIKFAEQMLGLLDRGSFVATYKYAVLLGLMDLCLEGTTKSGKAPDMVTTRRLTQKVVEIYWPHTVPYKGGRVLKQNTGRQAKILSDIAAFKETLANPSCSLNQAIVEAPRLFEKLIDQVEWTLILMPLPRVQVLGGREQQLLYQINWDLSIERKKKIVSEYQRSGAGPFDNRILFLPGVSDYLVMLNGLLRPLIHRQWVAMVASINDLEQSKLEEFLFGADRKALSKVRPALLELQDNRCFYCETKISGTAEVDHFVPWARYSDNGIENLVAADRRCNKAKRDFLASADHVSNWVMRNAPGSITAGALVDIARARQWETHPEQTLGVVRGIYLRLSRDVLLWNGIDNFVPADVEVLRQALAWE